MKKTYISPKSLAMDFLAENMLAMSVQTTDETMDGSNAWSNNKEWGSKSIWGEK